MKNIIILGVARSGKSTFARMINQKLRYNIICVDSFISAFEKIYPNLGMKHHGSQNHLVTPFVLSYLEAINYNHSQTNCVVEGWHMRLEDVCQAINPNTTQIIVLGYPQLTAKEVLNNIRKYEGKYDYTKAMSDEQILELVTRHIKHSQEWQKQCEEKGVLFIDTSFNRTEVLSKALEQIETNTKRGL